MNEYIKINPVGGSGGSIPPNSITSNDITLGSQASGSITVLDYTNLAGASFDLINPSTSITLTFQEGVDWIAEISNNITAAHITSAINTRINSVSALLISVSFFGDTVTLLSTINSESQNWSISTPAPTYLTTVGMTGGLGDFTFPGVINGKATNFQVLEQTSTNILIVDTYLHITTATLPTIYLGTLYNAYIRADGPEIKFYGSLGHCGSFAPPSYVGDTGLILYDLDTASAQRVSVGAVDSGGVGYKVLRIPN